MMKTIIYSTAALVLAATLSGCAGEDVSAATTDTESMRSLSDVRAIEWEALANRRIFFGHQSVGRNILAGVRQVLEREPQITLRLVESENPGAIQGPAFIDANIGRNGDPESKANAFVRAIEQGFGDSGGIAMFKYCYVDVTPGTDIDKLFEDYATRIDSLKTVYPGLTIVHVTLPLKRLRGGKREWVKRLLGRSTDMALHVKRNRYNELLRARYQGTDPIFDLAMLESTRADGSRSAIRYRGRTVYTLAPEWTDDGAHLNEAAQIRVAEQLLILLATMSDDTQASDSTATSGASRAS